MIHEICALAVSMGGRYNMIELSRMLKRALVPFILLLIALLEGWFVIKSEHGTLVITSLAIKGSHTDGCDAVFDASGREVSPPSACDACSAPWLSTRVNNSSEKVCRCMGTCRGVKKEKAGARVWTEDWDSAARAQRPVQLVIGLGTGRCGTQTLSQLLNMQPQPGYNRDHFFTHEAITPPLVWDMPSKNLSAAKLVIKKSLDIIRQRRFSLASSPSGHESGPTQAVVGDVAFFYLSWVRLILEVEPSTKFIVLERTKEEVVRSYYQKMKGYDLWSECVDHSKWKLSTAEWWAANPKFPCDNGQPDMKASLSMYWDYYRMTVKALQDEFPDRIRVFTFPAIFEDKAQQQDMLSWAGFQDVYSPGDVERFNCYTNCRDGVDVHQSGEKKQDQTERSEVANAEAVVTNGRVPSLAFLFPGLSTVDYSIPINAYFINLVDSRSRREYVETTFGKLWGPSKVIRVRGVDGRNEIDVFKFVDTGEEGRRAYERQRNFSGSNGMAALGNTLSHLVAIRQAYLDNQEAAIIIEDDPAPYFMPYWTQGIGDILTTLKTVPWDSVQLQYTFGVRAFDPPPARELLGGNLYKVSFQWGTGAYIISREGMKKVLDKYFTSRTAEGKIIPAANAEGRATVIDDDFFPPVLKNHYVTVSKEALCVATHCRMH